MIKVTSIQKITNLKWLNLFNANYETETGGKGVWTFASRKVEPTADKADAVIIIPLLKVGRTKRKLVTIKEFRIPINCYEHGFPAGLYDNNETATQVAARELKEETGLTATKFLYVGPPCASSAGLSDESVVYVVCECEGEVSLEGNEETEDISVNLLDIKEIHDLCKSKEKISAKALPFLLMFSALDDVCWPRHMEFAV